MSKHTEGEARVDTDYILVGSQCIAECYTSDVSGTEAEANVERLVRGWNCLDSYEQMVEVLEGCERVLRLVGPVEGSLCATWAEKARAALTAAKEVGK